MSTAANAATTPEQRVKQATDIRNFGFLSQHAASNTPAAECDRLAEIYVKQAAVRDEALKQLRTLILTSVNAK